MGDQIKNMLVGLVMLAACAFTISLILFLKPSIGDGGKTYCIRFSNINGIGDGTRVMFAGRPVGEVVCIAEIHEAREQPSDPFGRTYFYQLTIRVDSSVTIYTTDQISIQTSGLLGEKSIAITPIAPPKNVVPKAIGKEPIYAQSSDPLETAFAELSQLANEMEGTFRYLNDWLGKNGNTLAAAVNSFKGALDQAEEALSTINKTQLIEEAKRGITNFSEAMGKIDASLQEMQQGGFFTNANAIASSIKQVTGSIAEGKGTIGRLVEREDMYLQLESLLSKTGTLLNDINNYGILFHLNKTWQKNRLQKMAQMSSLKTPTAFKDYFSQEVESVNLSMGRLSLLMDKASRDPDMKSVFQDKHFTEDFAEFLREINQLSDSVKLYNEQLSKMQE